MIVVINCNLQMPLMLFVAKLVSVSLVIISFPHFTDAQVIPSLSSSLSPEHLRGPKLTLALLPMLR